MSTGQALTICAESKMSNNKYDRHRTHQKINMLGGVKLIEYKTANTSICYTLYTKSIHRRASTLSPTTNAHLHATAEWQAHTQTHFALWLLLNGQQVPLCEFVNAIVGCHTITGWISFNFVNIVCCFLYMSVNSHFIYGARSAHKMILKYIWFEHKLVEYIERFTSYGLRCWSSAVFRLLCTSVRTCRLAGITVLVRTA